MFFTKSGVEIGGTFRSSERKLSLMSPPVKANDAAVGLRRVRKALNLTQQKLAEKAECSVAMVGLLEGGYRPADSQVAERIKAVLDETAARRG
jgi:predicted transcriptional regulator